MTKAEVIAAFDAAAPLDIRCRSQDFFEAHGERRLEIGFDAPSLGLEGFAACPCPTDDDIPEAVRGLALLAHEWIQMKRRKIASNV